MLRRIGGILDGKTKPRPCCPCSHVPSVSRTRGVPQRHDSESMNAAAGAHWATRWISPLQHHAGSASAVAGNAILARFSRRLIPALHFKIRKQVGTGAGFLRCSGSTNRSQFNDTRVLITDLWPRQKLGGMSPWLVKYGALYVALIRKNRRSRRGAGGRALRKCSRPVSHGDAEDIKAKLGGRQTAVSTKWD